MRECGYGSTGRRVRRCSGALLGGWVTGEHGRLFGAYVSRDVRIEVAHIQPPTAILKLRAKGAGELAPPTPPQR